MKKSGLLRSVVFAALMLAGSGISRAEILFSYVDDNGVRIFTNIAPKGPVQDLKMSGQPLAAPGPTGPAGNTKSEVPYDGIIDKYAEEYRLDPALIRSMIATESSFNPKAVSRKGAQGLMQLMPSTAARHGVRDTFDPEENIRGGMKHMRFLLDTFGNDLNLSLAAYNAGENLVQRLGRIPDFKETHDYVRNIKQRYGKSTVTYDSEATAKSPTTFRFTDQNGVLHLTNIPPVQRAARDGDVWAQSRP
jgi:soluble lytic murein transglycosylase-like protein